MADTIAKMKTALQAAQGYGATTVLFVPCKIGGMPMPEPWEFDIRFDEKTGHLKQVVAGDNAKYQQVHRGPRPRDRRLAGRGAEADPHRGEDGRDRRCWKTCGTISG